MNARTQIYGLTILVLLLFVGCSQDDVTQEVSPEKLVAMSFAAEGEEGSDGTYKTYGTYNKTTRASYHGAMNSEDLLYTGFGVFACLTTDKKPDLMYNQEVAFTFVGDMDNSLKGYWSYQPVKYWPADMSHFSISAYAPYVDPSELDADKTGIFGISNNTQSPYIEYRRCEKPEECVDLLWYYETPTAIPTPSGMPRGTLSMKMHHALARLEINVNLAAPLAADTKVLIESISLTGKMAKTGHLSLSSQVTETEEVESEEVTKYYPVWSDQVNDKDGSGNDINHTFLINNNDKDDRSYGIIDAPVRYIQGLPYAWQPAGLSTTAQNALSTGDRKTYIYLIPQDSALELTVKVKCHKMTSAGGDDTIIKTTDAVPTPVKVFTTVGDAKILRGNTRYSLNLTLSGI